MWCFGSCPHPGPAASRGLGGAFGARAGSSAPPAHGTPQQAAQLARFGAAARAAAAAGLEVNAGHDLNRANLTDFLRAAPEVVEVSIGHALVADALELGMAETVRQYLACIREAAR